MTWDGGPAGWVPPAERKAAEEAAAKFERERAAADARTEALADAIRGGFGVLADAILVAAGASSHERDAFFAGTGEPEPPAPPPPAAGPAVDVGVPDDDDPDIADLIDDGGQ